MTSSAISDSPVDPSAGVLTPSREGAAGANAAPDERAVPLAAIVWGVFGLRGEPAVRSVFIWAIVFACVATFGSVVVVAASALISLPFLFFAVF
jgi:hypothetical protein